MHVSARNITFGYDRVPVLNDVSFDVSPGDFLSIAGPNGCGKSTLLRLIAGILKPQGGTLSLNHQPSSAFTRRELARAIGYVPQDAQWLFPFTVMEAVLMGRTPSIGRWGFERQQDIDLCHEALALTDITHLAAKPVTAISGGERQRVLIARAFAQQPTVLLLDEPNAHLDLSHQLDIFQILHRQHRERKLTVLCVSHDLNLAAAFSTRVLMLMESVPGLGNTIVAQGAPEEVLTEEMVQRVFRTTVLVDRHPLTARPRISLDPASPVHR
ncbi:MAG: ABC transporter ATP-binding protein [Ignavibacteriales bacterium]|nr:ABC transporter ATP-binding protein [Ignavibacteriales bacterium]